MQRKFGFLPFHTGKVGLYNATVNAWVGDDEFTVFDLARRYSVPAPVGGVYDNDNLAWELYECILPVIGGDPASDPTHWQLVSTQYQVGLNFFEPIAAALLVNRYLWIRTGGSSGPVTQYWERGGMNFAPGDIIERYSNDTSWLSYQRKMYICISATSTANTTDPAEDTMHWREWDRLREARGTQRVPFMPAAGSGQMTVRFLKAEISSTFHVEDQTLYGFDPVWKDTISLGPEFGRPSGMVSLRDQTAFLQPTNPSLRYAYTTRTSRVWWTVNGVSHFLYNHFANNQTQPPSDTLLGDYLFEENYVQFIGDFDVGPTTEQIMAAHFTILESSVTKVYNGSGWYSLADLGVQSLDELALEWTVEDPGTPQCLYPWKPTGWIMASETSQDDEYTATFYRWIVPRRLNLMRLNVTPHQVIGYNDDPEVQVWLTQKVSLSEPNDNTAVMALAEGLRDANTPSMERPILARLENWWSSPVCFGSAVVVTLGVKTATRPAGMSYPVPWGECAAVAGIGYVQTSVACHIGIMDGDNASVDCVDVTDGATWLPTDSMDYQYQLGAGPCQS